MTYSEISFCTPQETIVKENSTVGNLIEILKELPLDLPVSAAFRCILDVEGNLVSLEDEKVNALLDILLDCPFCSKHFETNQPTIN